MEVLFFDIAKNKFT